MKRKVAVEIMADSARTVQVMKECLGAVGGVVVGGAGWRADCIILQPVVVGRGGGRNMSRYSWHMNQVNGTNEFSHRCRTTLENFLTRLPSPQCSVVAALHETAPNAEAVQHGTLLQAHSTDCTAKVALYHQVAVETHFLESGQN